MRRRKRLIGFVAVVMLIIGGGNMRLRAVRAKQPALAKQSYKTVYDRAAEICSALGTTCELDPKPVFSAKRVHCYFGDNTPLRLWKFMCLVDGRPTWLIFNDDTVGMCYLLAERTLLDVPTPPRANAINTRADAAEAGFQRLKAMKLLAHGSMVALHGQPYMNTFHNQWAITWIVKTDSRSAPYSIRMVLDRRTASPISIVDTHALAAPNHS